MTVKAFDSIRVQAALGLFDWSTQPMAAGVPKIGYVFDPTHFNTSVMTPFRGSTVTLINQVVTPTGWLRSNLISFNDTPNDGAFDQVIIYRISDQMLMVAILFPPIVTNGAPMTVLYGVGNPGLCRL
jgi:hypothetical protein